VFQELLVKLAFELNASRIPYMVIGGQAVLLYGEPRLTKDIDITLGIGADKYKSVTALAERLSLKILVENTESFVKKTMVLPLLEEQSGIRIDFLFSFSPYETQAIKRSKSITSVPQINLPYNSRARRHRHPQNNRRQATGY